MKNKLVKSKERVKNFGEVYTPSNIVNKMLDLDGIKECSYSIDKTFLEPSCGNGNFLIEILRRKIETVEKLDKEQYDLNIIQAISTIYGIDIKMDNVKESINRMLEYITSKYKEFNGVEISDKLLKVVKLILKRNIQCGDTIEGVEYKRNEIKTNKELIITEWKFTRDKIQRTDIEFNNLIKENNVCYNTPYKEYEEIDYLNIADAKEKESNDIGYDLSDII